MFAFINKEEKLPAVDSQPESSFRLLTVSFGSVKFRLEAIPLHHQSSLINPHHAEVPAGPLKEENSKLCKKG